MAAASTSTETARSVAFAMPLLARAAKTLSTFGFEPVAMRENDPLGCQTHELLCRSLHRPAAKAQQQPQIDRRHAIGPGVAKQIRDDLV